MARNFVTITKEGIGHILDLTPIEEKKERKPQKANIKLSYFHGKDNVEANLDWEIKVEQQLKKKSTSKSCGSHSYPKKDQGQGILGVTPSKPKDDKGKTIEKQAPKASLQEKTSSIKCFKCLGRGHITSQCPTTKTMIMRGQDIYSSQDEATTSPSSSESEKEKGEESSEEIYPQEEGQPLVVKEKCKEVSVSSNSLAKKETHFTIMTNIKETFPLRQPPHFLFCKKALASIATPLGLEFIPQVKKLLDEGLVRKSLNPCALLVPKIGIIRYQVPKIGGMMNVLSGATLFCKITRAPNIFMVCVDRDSLGSDQGVPTDPKRIKVILDWPTPPSIREIWGCHDLTNFYKRFVPYFSILVAPLIELVRNRVPSWEDVHERSVGGRSPEYEEPRDLRSNPFQGGRDDAILPPKGIG
ncbi:putative mitochondrial protein [Glycine soja]